MNKNQTIIRVMRFFITLLGAGIGAGAAALALSVITRVHPSFQQNYLTLAGVYFSMALLGALLFFLCSMRISKWLLSILSAMERDMDKMSVMQITFSMSGLIGGLLVAFLISQLILSAGASLITISVCALTYVTLGYLGLRMGRHQARDGKGLRHLLRRRESTIETIEEPESQPEGCRKYLDTSVIIDGRILDIVKTGFLEGEIVVPQFVLAELRHIADSGDGMRRARGRRGLDMLQKLQKEIGIIVDETDFSDVTEVDVKLLRICKEQGGAVITNDYNLNKVAGVTGIRVLNINDLANAVKPMLITGEELNVQVVREGKEPGQGVAYLDDGTMIVIENGRRYVGQKIAVTVTTVLQTSAGRMIFTKVSADEVHPKTAV